MSAARASAAKAPGLHAAAPAPALPQRRASAGFATPLASLASVPARPPVQRKCSACEGEKDEKTPVQPRLEVGPVGDRYEREADAIAGRVMAMRDGAASAAEPGVQRKCGACSSLREEPRARRLSEDAEEGKVSEKVQARHVSADGGGETIAAPESALVSGGAPLPAATRRFFEERMDRDLGDVRVHEGAGSQHLNESISARAFTYRNHIWLGGGESARPSFTMAHELAHVMQQTAPGPLGPAPQRVQRVTCDLDDHLYFFPKGGFDATPFHDETTKWATDKDKSLLGEVRIPNANRAGFTAIPPGRKGTFGFADLVMATPTNLVGMGFQDALPPPLRPLAKPPPGPPPQPWFEVPSPVDPKRRMTPSNLNTFKTFYRAGKEFSDAATNRQMDAKAAPRWDGTDFVRDAATAPTDIRLGEVKHGGDRDRSEAAKTQLERYVKGFEEANRSYETMRRQNALAWAGSPQFIGKSATKDLAPWTLSAGLISGWSGPKGWDKVGGDRKLVVWRYKDEQYRPCENAIERDGSQYAQHDEDKGFLWIYAFCPNNINPVGTAATTETFRAEAKTANSLKADLVASPAKPGKPARRPLARPRRRVAATHDRRGLARAAKTKPKPVPAEDLFATNYESWKTRQRALSGDFDKLGNTKKGKDAIGARLFDTAAANTAAITGRLPAKVKGRPPTRASQREERKTFNTILLMSGASGRFLGAMRKTFGAAFIRVINIYQKLRDKFKEFMDGRKGQAFSSKSRLAKVAMKVGGMILAAIIHQIMPGVAHLLMQCIESGFAASLEKMFGEDLQTLVGDRIEDVEKQIAALEETVKANVESVIGSITGDLTTRYEDLIKAWDKASTLISIAKDAFNVARLAACAATGIETIGIGCVIAGADFVLSLFDVSPSEALAASLLNTCTAQKMIGDLILTIDAVRSLPKTLADMIVNFLRPILPSFTIGTLKIDLAEMLCKSVGTSSDLPAVEDVTCGKSLSDPGAPAGKDWRPPGDVDLNILNRKPTPEEIAKHGRLPPPGSVPAQRREEPKPPPKPTGTGTPPAPSTPAQPGAGEGGGGNATHGIRGGDLTTGPGWQQTTRNTDFYIHGKGGGFAPRAYAGELKTVFITAVDSHAVYYGPEEITIKVHLVFEDPDKKGAHKIEFEPLEKKILWFKSVEKTVELQLDAERRVGRVGAPM